MLISTEIQELKVCIDDKETIEWCALFNTTAYYHLHKTSDSFYFKLVKKSDTIAVAHFTCTNDRLFKSPYRGTFGGISFSKANYSELKFFVAAIEVELKKRMAKAIQLALPPLCHEASKTSLLFQVLTASNYQLKSSALNYSIPVDKRAFESKIKRNNQKRLRKCRRSGMEFYESKNKKDSAIIFSIIEKNRAAKGYKLSMNFNQIWEMHESLSNRVLFFGISYEEELIAGSVCIKISDEHLYVFYWGDLPGFEQFSPVVFLAEGIYNFAFANAYRILDIGTSMLGNQLNEKLATFKMNLGCEASLKFTMQKNLV